MGPSGEHENLDAELVELGEAVCVLDRDYRVIRVNAAQERLSGLPRERTLGHRLWDLWPDTARPDLPFWVQYHRCMDERVTVEFEAFYAPLEFWAHIMARPTRSGIAIFFRDITARRRAEDDLRASAATLRTLVVRAPFAVAMFDRQLRFLAHSQQFLADGRLNGDRDLTGAYLYDVFPHLPDSWRQRHDRCLAGETLGSPSDVFEHGDGSTTPILWELVPWHDASGQVAGMILFSLNLSEIRRVETELANERRLLASIIDGTPSLIWAFDDQHRVLLANSAAANFLGVSKEAMIGRHPSEINPSLIPADFEVRQREVMASGEPQIEEVRIPFGDGERAVMAARHPLRTAAGDIFGTASITTDVTHLRRVEAELRTSEQRTRAALAELEKALDTTRRTEEKLRQSQKMEAVGRLAGGVAHDFNNLLTVILGFGEELVKNLTPGDPLRDSAIEIERAGRRAAGLTRQLLAFSRQQVLEPRRVVVNGLIQGVQSMLRRLLGEDIELTLLLHPKLHACRIDPAQFEQAVINLAVNARDAMPEGGRLTIETANVWLGDEYVTEHPDASAGEHVLVSVSDTGIGMSRETRERLFEPFFTTKELGRGTGLGLSMVYGIVRQSGGTIWAYSEPGQGTTFKIYLPRTMAPDEERNVPTPVSRSHGSETILLVEDDEQVRTTITAMLVRAGYHVIGAANGGEALLICEQHGGRIQLMLTDVVMPKLNGRKLADRLRQILPAMRVIFMSGYTENAIVHHGVLDSGLDFIPKPISSDALLAKVREVLDR